MPLKSWGRPMFSCGRLVADMMMMTNSQALDTHINLLKYSTNEIIDDIEYSTKWAS